MEPTDTSPPSTYQSAESRPNLPPSSRKAPGDGQARLDLPNDASEACELPPTRGQHNGQSKEDSNSKEPREPGAPLEGYNWVDLEEKFEAAMEKRGEIEDSLQKDFQKLVEVSITKYARYLSL